MAANLFDGNVRVSASQDGEHMLERLKLGVLVHGGDVVQFVVDYIPV